MDGVQVERAVTKIRWNIAAAEKDGFPHFTLKEIYEQPHAIGEALRGRVDEAGNVTLPELDAIEEKLRKVERVYVVGCGTARYAGEVGAHLIQSWAGLPANGQIGSEMRYSPPPIDDRTLVISVSQSGETADTLAPQKLASERGAVIVVVTNVVGSALTREADAVCYLQAGPEVAVASTKAFVTQVVVLADDRPAPGQAARHPERPAPPLVRARPARPPRAGGRGPQARPAGQEAGPGAGAACAT